MAYDSRPTGVLATLVDNIHEWSNESKVKAKYTPSKLYPLIQANWKEVFSEILRMSDNSFVAEHSFTMTNNDTTTLLPANVGVIERIIKKNATTGNYDYEIYNRSRRNPGAPVFRLEGNVLRWIPKWTYGSETLVMEYSPNGETQIAYGTATTARCSDTVVELSTSPTDGYFDPRPYAYVGAWIRVLGAGSSLNEIPDGYSFFPTQERIIKSYVTADSVNDKPVVTVEPAFDFDLSSGDHNASAGFTDIRYEIVPEGLQALTPVIAWRTIMTIHRMEGNTKRKLLAQEEFASKFRDVKMTVANLNPSRDNRWEHDTKYQLRDLWAVL